MQRQRWLRSDVSTVTSKDGLRLVAVVALIGSGCYWWSVENALSTDWRVAGSFAILLTLAPPVLTSFLIPWSPAGMLLQKINARTWGYTVVIGSDLYLLYYSIDVQYSWWMATVPADLQIFAPLQIGVGIIGFIIIPALLWTPVTSEELVEQVRQAHLVHRYELQVQADIAILRATLMNAQEKALIGFANLTIEDRDQLVGVMRGLVKGIDQTLSEIRDGTKAVTGATIPLAPLNEREDIRGYLDQIDAAITDRPREGADDLLQEGVRERIARTRGGVMPDQS